MTFAIDNGRCRDGWSNIPRPSVRRPPAATSTRVKNLISAPIVVVTTSGPLLMKIGMSIRHAPAHSTSARAPRVRLKCDWVNRLNERCAPCGDDPVRVPGSGSKNPHFSDVGHGQMVPRKGLEPSRPLSHWHLKPARLPIPPPGPGRVSKDRSHACQIGELRSALLIFGPSPVRKTASPLFRGSAQIYCTAEACWRIANPLNTPSISRIRPAGTDSRN